MRGSDFVFVKRQIPFLQTPNSSRRTTTRKENPRQQMALARKPRSPCSEVCFVDGIMCTRSGGKEGGGKTGYSPAGIRGWDQTPSTHRGRKRSFQHSKVFPMSDELIRDHLLGKRTIGVCPYVTHRHTNFWVP